MKILSVTALLLLIGSTGCGGDWAPPMFQSPRNTSYVHVKVDPLLKPSFLSFLAHCEQFPKVEHLCKQNLQNLRSIRFAPDSAFEKKSTVGHCVVNNWGHRFIEIRSGSYEPDSSTFVTLMYHELGHCLLNSGHAPKGVHHIMSPFLLPEWISKEKWPALVKTLFTVQYSWDVNEAHNCSSHN